MEGVSLVVLAIVPIVIEVCHPGYSLLKGPSLIGVQGGNRGVVYLDKIYIFVSTTKF